jgi:hypothetical protein
LLEKNAMWWSQVLQNDQASEIKCQYNEMFLFSSIFSKDHNAQ